MAVDEIKTWFEKAIPLPTIDNQRIQTAVFLEECSELFDTIEEKDSTNFAMIKDCNSVIKNLSNNMKVNRNFKMLINDRKEFLDALCDIIVTVIGTGHVYGFDIIGALSEVSRSNNSKFDDHGNPIFNEQGKIAKGPNYTAPVLESFVGTNPIQ